MPCFSFGSRSCHQSVSLVTRVANPSMAPVSKSHRVRTYSRYTAIGSITVFNPIADSCFPNTNDIPMPLPMNMMLTLSANSTHLRSSKSRAVHIPTTIRNITGRKSCKIGAIACFNANGCRKIACQSLLIQEPISLPSVMMNGSKPCTNAMTKHIIATMPLIRQTEKVNPMILVYLAVSAVLRDFQFFSSSFSRLSCFLSCSARSLAACSSSLPVCSLTFWATAASIVSFSAFCCAMSRDRSASQLLFLAS